MTLTSRRIAIVPRAAANSLGLLSLAASLLVFLGGPLAGPRFVGLLGVLWLIAPILSFLAIRAARGSAADGGTVALTDNGVSVTQGVLVESFALDEIHGALIRESVAHSLEVGLRDGDVISVELDDAAAGREFLRRLASSGANRRQAIRANQPFLSWAPLSTSAGLILWALLSAAGIVGAAIGPNPLLRAVLFASAIVATWVFVHRRASAGLTLAGDGITIARPFSARFHPWSAISTTTIVHGNVVLRLRDGELVAVASRHPNGAATIALIDRALATFRARQDDAATAALDRAGRTIEDWRAALAALTREENDRAYRGAQLPRTTLEDVLEDPRATAERRIGAAIALRALDADYTTRVRLAAESCANEHLRIALEKVADDELSVAAVDDATRAEQS